MRIFQSLYDRVLRWSVHPHARRYLAGLSVAEATFFPVPPDVMLAPMVLADRASAWRLATLTTVASVVGGIVGYAIGYLALELILPWLTLAGQEPAYLRAVDAFTRFGILFVVVAGFTPIPFKMITLAAGALTMPLPGFVLGAVLGRGARFFLVAALIWAGGPHAAERLRLWVDAIGWLVIALLGLIGVLVWLQ